MVFRENCYLCLAVDLFLLARREVSSVVGKQNLVGPRHGRSHGLPYADLLFRRLRRRRPLAGRIWKHTGSLLGIRGRMRMDIPTSKARYAVYLRTNANKGTQFGNTQTKGREKTE